MPTGTKAQTSSLAVDGIRHAGAGQLQVMGRLRAVFDDLAEVVPEGRAAAIQLEMALHAVRRAVPDAGDQTRGPRVALHFLLEVPQLGLDRR